MKVFVIVFLCVSFSSGVLLGLYPWSHIWFTMQCMVQDETTTPDCSGLARSSLDDRQNQLLLNLSEFVLSGASLRVCFLVCETS